MPGQHTAEHKEEEARTMERMNKHLLVVLLFMFGGGAALEAQMKPLFYGHQSSCSAGLDDGHDAVGLPVRAIQQRFFHRHEHGAVRHHLSLDGGIHGGRTEN